MEVANSRKKCHGWPEHGPILMFPLFFIKVSILYLSIKYKTKICVFCWLDGCEYEFKSNIYSSIAGYIYIYFILFLLLVPTNCPHMLIRVFIFNI
jgi:hypothetical protein